jgi:hypothetical protein
MSGNVNRGMRTLDDLIFEIAEYQRDADFDEFCARMQSQVFYLPLAAPLSGPHGTNVTVGNEAMTKYVVMENRKLFVFFTSDTHRNLGPICGAINGAEALRMTLASPEVDGALFHNVNASWIGLDKQKCEHVLGLAHVERPYRS